MAYVKWNLKVREWERQMEAGRRGLGVVWVVMADNEKDVFIWWGLMHWWYFQIRRL